MARTEARITCAIWDDEDYRDLTWEAQWLYKTLLTQKDLSLCGVLTWTPKRFSKLASNASASATRKALDLLREKRYVVLDDDTDELLVRSLIRRDRVLGNHNSIVGCSKAFEAIHSGMVRDAIVEEVCRVVREGLAIGGTEGGTPTGWLTGLPDHIRKRVGQPFAKAVALTCTRPPPSAPVPPASGLLPPASQAENGSSSKLSVVGDAGAEEEDHHGQGPSPTDDVGQVAQLVAERRWAKLSDERRPPEGIRRERWLEVTAADVLAKSAGNIPNLLAGGMALAAVVDLFEPPERPAPTASGNAQPSRDHVPSPYDEEWDPETQAWRLVDRSVSA